LSLRAMVQSRRGPRRTTSHSMHPRWACATHTDPPAQPAAAPGTDITAGQDAGRDQNCPSICPSKAREFTGSVFESATGPSGWRRPWRRPCLARWRASVEASRPRIRVATAVASSV